MCPNAVAAVTCPSDCSGNGVCESISYHATKLDKGLQPAAYYFSYANNWDASMIYGCTCDVGFGGPDCSARTCATGDDPMTTGQSNDVQVMRCDLTAALYPGQMLTLSFLGAISAPFPIDAPAATVAAVLNALPTVRLATVAYTPGFTTFCDSTYASTAVAGPPLVPASGNAISISIAAPTGPQPGILVLTASASVLTGTLDNNVWTAHSGDSLPYATGGGAYGTLSSMAGTKENAACR